MGRTRPSRWSLPLPVLVFVVGAASLGSELAVARLIAPYFGASLLVWANTIAVVLGALSVGYWLGGRWADRHPGPEGLAWVVVLAAALLGAVPFVSEPVLRLSGLAFARLSVGIFAGSLLALLGLVAVPTALIGAVAPWAIRLHVRGVQDSGRASGRLYAISTVGSLCGTFTAALVLIPDVGTRRTFLTFAVVLALAALPSLPRPLVAVPVALGLAFAVPAGPIKPAAAGTRVLYETQTDYQFAEVVQFRDGTRVLQLNEGEADHSLWRPGTVLTGGYWDSALTLPRAVLAGPPRSMAILGNAAGTIDRAYAHYFPRTTLYGVEIDGALTRIGYRYFGLRPRPRLHLVTADARPWLRLTHRHFDVVVVDAYFQPYIPFYLTTVQFFALVRRDLTPGGVVIVNVGQPPGQTALERALAATMGTVWPHVARVPVAATNTMLLASEASISARRLAHASEPNGLGPLARREARDLGPPLPGRTVFTDDRAPIENLVDRSLLNYASRPRP